MAKRWYVLHARNGFEAKVKQAIYNNAERAGVRADIDDILIPTEQVVELKSGKKKTAERKFFPGYMLINMQINDTSWLVVNNTENVIGFIGGVSGKPSPISQKEVDKVLARVADGEDAPKPKVAYQIGEEVLITDGPFNEFNGTIQSVDYEKSIIKVEVMIFGRTSTVDLEFTQIDKLV